MIEYCSTKSKRVRSVNLQKGGGRGVEKKEKKIKRKYLLLQYMGCCQNPIPTLNPSLKIFYLSKNNKQKPDIDFKKSEKQDGQLQGKGTNRTYQT